MRALILSAAVAMLTTAAAVAQQPAQPMAGHMMGQGMMPMMGMMNPAQHVEGRLAFLKTELKITDAQAPQWDAYAEAMRANAKRMGELMDEAMSSGMMGHGMMMDQGMAMQGQSAPRMSLPDRMNWAEQHMTAHMEMLKAIKGPTIQLYSVLSDEQKRMADQLLGPMGMMGSM